MNNWPGDWHSKRIEPSEPGFTNDHGILYLIGDSAEEYLSFVPGDKHLSEIHR